ncbi:sulfotransferase 1A1-like isoform X2 [Pomacea canaliculata]|uniref:sulfotransferase 1A1-like isoform X2 n=1 Tax=Pomacea canaliculata TaxID=400727 RepID=UPI000D73C37A|nr:sulfotransferase 1A1-like isoform X2 [Pomacea canaliculata]
MSGPEDSAAKMSDMEKKELRDLVIPVVEGIPLPILRSTTGWEKHIADLRKMELQDDDILLCSYPKTGTHWLWEVTSMLVQGKAEYETRRKEQLMVEFVDVDMIEAMASPRILNTHLPFSMLPWQQIRDKRVKVLHVYRNPKDTAVSMYFMMKDVWKLHGKSLEFSDFFEQFITGKVMYGGYFNYLRQFNAFARENPTVPVLTISFEEMKRNPAAKVQQLAEFLKVPASQQLCEKIAEACSFQNMKKQDDNKEEPEICVKTPLPKITMYRKGEVGDWKNYFTVAMSERMDTVVNEEMKDMPLVIQYS